jgi:hypothetical protein
VKKLAVVPKVSVCDCTIDKFIVLIEMEADSVMIS